MQNPMDIPAEELIARLTAQVESLSRDNERLARDNAELARAAADAARGPAAVAEELRAELAAVRAERDRLIELVRLSNQRFFGCRSEKVIPDQLSLFNDMEAAADESPEPAFEDAVPAKPRKRGGKRKVDYSKLEQVVVRHELPAGSRECPGCGAEMEEFNVEVTYSLRMVPAHLVAERNERAVYRCPGCCAANAAGGEAPAAIVRAPMPAPPIRGSFATPSLIAYVVNGKYSNSLPLYRMEQDFRCLGADISRQNMANWVMRSWELWLSRLRARMKDLLLMGDIVHADETEVQVLREPGREAKCKSRMWLFAAPACDRPIYVYEYNPTRKGKVAGDFLRGWSGWLVTDGYAPYFSLGNGGEVRNVACLAHVRRKFVEVVKLAGGDAKAAGTAALEGRRRIDAMFAADAGFSAMAAAGDFEGRRLARERELRPLMEDFLAWARAARAEAAPRMALANALDYAIKYWPHVMGALEDGRLPLDNNLAERGIKPFVIGRKNFLFSDTPRGAEASAGWYSAVVTAKANGLNPRKYVQWLLEEMPNAADPGDPAYLDSLMPWSESVPAEIKLGPEAAAKAAEMADDPIIDIDPSAFSADEK